MARLSRTVRTKFRQLFQVGCVIPENGHIHLRHIFQDAGSVRGIAGGVLSERRPIHNAIPETGVGITLAVVIMQVVGADTATELTLYGGNIHSGDQGMPHIQDTVHVRNITEEL